MRSIRPDVFLGRQPIFNRAQQVVAYELLFRSDGEQHEAVITDGALATAKVITHAFRDLGICTVVGRSKAFINVNAESLLSRMIESLPQDRVVLELLETVDIDDRVIKRCRRLKAMGYKLALDDMVSYHDYHDPLLDIVDIVKIDLLQTDSATLPALVERLKLKPAMLLAEKVDSLESAHRCIKLGFHFFQGFFCGRPLLLAA